jgi:hypothetical protein
MPATGLRGRFTGITRGDAFIDIRRRVASGAVAPMGRSYGFRGGSIAGFDFGGYADPFAILTRAQVARRATCRRVSDGTAAKAV